MKPEMTKRDKLVAMEAIKAATDVCVERIKARLGGSVDEVEDELRRLRKENSRLEQQCRELTVQLLEERTNNGR